MTEPYYSDDHVTLHHGDCRDVLATLPDASVDAVVTDPPYELAFMGKGWDSSGIAFDVAMWAEVLRVLKPGGHLLAFGGTRTWHRMVVAIEDAGFEIRDEIMWQHAKPLFCQCGPVQYSHDDSSPEGVPGVRPDVDAGGQAPGGAQQDVQSGVHGQADRTGGEWPEAGAEAAHDADLHGVRGDLRAPDEPRGPSGGGDVLAPVQRAAAGRRAGEALAQGSRRVDGRESAVVPGEDDRRPQPGMEGRRDLLAQEGQLPADQVRAGSRVGAADGPQGRVHHGAPAAHGADGGATPDPVGGGAPRGPQPAEQRADEPGTVAVKWIAQGGGAWPGCPRCGEPLAPPFHPGPLTWNYGSGFPKSLDVSKAIDKAAGAEREIVGETRRAPSVGSGGTVCQEGGDKLGLSLITAPATAEAEQWSGFGTALKPAHEPICLARKPLTGTVAANVLEHGTGALNIDGCRIGMGDEYDPTKIQRQSAASAGMAGIGESGFAPDHAQPTYNAAGRWPANVVLDEEAAALLDAQSGTLTSGKMAAGTCPKGDRLTYGQDAASGYATTRDTPGDTGGASRFFYVAKAPTHERPKVDGKAHATVKPLTLIRWLVRLVTPPGGHVLDPFAGSGTTAEACIVEGFTCTLIEKDADHLPLITERLAKPIQPTMFGAS